MAQMGGTDDISNNGPQQLLDMDFDPIECHKSNEEDSHQLVDVCSPLR
jgi:hypothetical protein